MQGQAIREEKIALSALIVFGTGGIIPIALFNIAGQLMGLIGNISLGLSAFWLGVILIIPRLWDALSDPIVGHLSDNTRSRFGRRRPWLLAGAIAVAISFVLLWWVPKGEAVQNQFPTESAYQWFQLGYILFFLLVFFTACTVFEIPHGALGMEMSTDPHQRTRLFGAKSFFGNLFAMGTPWLFALANLEWFRGANGSEIDGMRYVSILVAAVLIPLGFWWFAACREPGAAAIARPRTTFRANMQRALGNRSFLCLVAVIFTLAMGFNFVGLLNYYIAIFYLYAGDKAAAGPLLGINGTVWAVTGLLAVFPLNRIAPRLGKRNTLVLAIGLMGAAQLAKIVCYNPAWPYLVIIPTVLLSSGMLFFFTLGSSMLGDVCDEDELQCGRRAEGSYYSIYWWFIKVGTALASFVTGALILFTGFDETQVTRVDSLRGGLREMHAALDKHTAKDRDERFTALAARASQRALELESHFAGSDPGSSSRPHRRQLARTAADIGQQLRRLSRQDRPDRAQAAAVLKAVEAKLPILARQAPPTLLRMRAVEIGLPLLLSLISLCLARRYPLTEARSQAIKAALRARRAVPPNKSFTG